MSGLPRYADGLPTSRANLAVHRLAVSELPGQLAQDIAQRLEAAIQARGAAVLSVSGGKSPMALFEALRRQPLDWSRVCVTLVDERCVPWNHPDSNARLVQTHLLQELASAARLVPMISANAQPLVPAALQAQQASTALSAAGTADVLVLGLGADGHTASLFPQALNLNQALNRHNPHACIAMELAQLPASAPFERLTQPLAQLLRARHIVLPVSGADKLSTLRLAWRAISDQYPISHLLHQTETPLAIWISS